MQSEISFYDACSAAAWAAVKKKPSLLPNSSEKPADIFVPNFSLGKGLVIDFAVTCPLQNKFLFDASLIQGFACNKYAQVTKIDNFESKVQEENLDYLPIVFETFGGVSSDAFSFVQKLVSAISIRFNEPRSFIKKSMLENISCILMKHIARSITSRSPDFKG